MDHLNRMAVKLMENHDLLSGEEKAEMLAEMKAATDKAKKSENRFVKALNSFLSHPVGVMLSLFGYCWMDGKMRRMNRDIQEDTMESTFHMKMQEAMYRKAAERMGVDLDEKE